MKTIKTLTLIVILSIAMTEAYACTTAIISGKYTVCLANPPFKGSVDACM